MTLHIPMGMRIVRIILLITAHLNLLESPLRQNRIRGPQITPKLIMLKPQLRRQRMNPILGF